MTSNPRHGQKVTTDPEGKRHPIQEGVGTVLSDSLAAESVREGGSFGEGNPKAGISNQPSSSTNTNNTDTSSASRLDPAIDAQAREAQEGWNEEKTISSAKGLGKESGVGPTYNSTGSATRGAVATASSGGRDGVQGNIAPTEAYAGQDLEAGVYKPKGTDLHEEKHLSGNTKFGAIGTKNDPARVAELNFQKMDAAATGAVRDNSGEANRNDFSGLNANEKA